MKLLTTSLTISSMIFLGSCGQFDASKHKDDPYGIIEAENVGGQPKRLVHCSQNIDCPEYASALFWVAVDELSELSANEIEISGKDFGLNKNMSVDEMAEKLGPQLDELLGPAEPTIYDLNDPAFKGARSKLEKAADAGSVYALNELGLLYLEIPDMQDFNAAERYFKRGMEDKDANAVYNLARLSAVRDPNSKRDILNYLDMAAKISPTEFQNSYMFGLQNYGTAEEKRLARDYFASKNADEISFEQSEFENLFNLQPKN